MTSIQQRAALQRPIRQIANEVRGSVDGWDFKQYVLGRLFYRFISENFSAYIEAGDPDIQYAQLADSVITPETQDDAIKTKDYFICRSRLFAKTFATANTSESLNADLHMAEDLKNTGKGNLFVIFGEPDIDVIEADSNHLQFKVNGVDVFDPTSGEVRSDRANRIACWFIDTDYNGESFFVRHAYFLGQNDPYKSLKTTLKAEINPEAWESLNSDLSRPFEKPKSGRIAIKVINHLGDEVMKVFRA